MDQNHSKAANTVSRKANMQKLRFLGSLLFLIKASESSHRNEGKCICVFLASLCIYIYVFKQATKHLFHVKVLSQDIPIDDNASV